MGVWGGRYVNVEIGIINIKTVNHLLEVDMSDAIAPNIMVIHNAELRARRHLLNEGLRRLEVSPPLGQRRRNARLSGEPRIAVISLGAQTEGIKVDRTAIDISPRRHERRVRERRGREQRDERGGGGQTHGDKRRREYEGVEEESELIELDLPLRRSNGVFIYTHPMVWWSHLSSVMVITVLWSAC